MVSCRLFVAINADTITASNISVPRQFELLLLSLIPALTATVSAVITTTGTVVVVFTATACQFFHAHCNYKLIHHHVVLPDVIHIHTASGIQFSIWLYQ
jgi:hypothetical protein